MNERQKMYLAIAIIVSVSAVAVASPALVFGVVLGFAIGVGISWLRLQPEKPDPTTTKPASVLRQKVTTTETYDTLFKCQYCGGTQVQNGKCAGCGATVR